MIRNRIMGAIEMKVLVTGGLGFIGSHTTVALIGAGHDVVIVDDLSNTSRDVYDRVLHISEKEKESVPFIEMDVTATEKIDALFSEHTFDGVIHFAGYKAVGESVHKPLIYYRNNLLSTIMLAEASLKHGVNRFVFSSSATVYGDNTVPSVESMELLPTTNPYGETKAMCERILTDTVAANPDFSIALLRYFNPVGAHESGLIGESPNGIPNNLMPYINQTANGIREKLSVYGGDYPTVDGTGIRDFIHVMDLAEGHVAAIEKIQKGVHTYNLGSGKGTSVLELIHNFVHINNVRVPYEIVDRRPGDLAVSYADVSKAEKEFGWKTKRSLEDICRDAWNFEKSN